MSKENFIAELDASVCYCLICDSCSFRETSDPDQFDTAHTFLADCYTRGWRYAESEECQTDCATVCPDCMGDSEQDWKEKYAQDKEAKDN